ncbi:MAG: class I SAM-dependent methyltransferase [Actinomycetota bacterium]|nr:class I SAM-dependent methyltransferase [Actinomycetota bacterium]
MDNRRALSFGTAAAAYDRGRPGYPADALRWLLPETASRVLDLGAGTGKLTASLLGLGLPGRTVVAVEPDRDMRVLVDPRATRLGGTAERIPLAEASVDAVLVGQAFHWFDPVAALPEVVRVLRPGGVLGLLWNVLDDSAEWVARLCDLWQAEDRSSLMAAGNDVPFDGPASGLSVPVRRVFRHETPVDRLSILDVVSSRSVIILLPEQERASVLAKAAALVPAPAKLPYVCDAWRAVRR